MSELIAGELLNIARGLVSGEPARRDVRAGKPYFTDEELNALEDSLWDLNLPDYIKELLGKILDKNRDWDSYLKALAIEHKELKDAVSNFDGYVRDVKKIRR